MEQSGAGSNGSSGASRVQCSMEVEGKTSRDRSASLSSLSATIVVALPSPLNGGKTGWCLSMAERTEHSASLAWPLASMPLPRASVAVMMAWQMQRACVRVRGQKTVWAGWLRRCRAWAHSDRSERESKGA